MKPSYKSTYKREFLSQIQLGRENLESWDNKNGLESCQGSCAMCTIGHLLGGFGGPRQSHDLVQNRLRQVRDLPPCGDGQISATTKRELLQHYQTGWLAMSVQLQGSPPCLQDRPRKCRGTAREVWLEKATGMPGLGFNVSVRRAVFRMHVTLRFHVVYVCWETCTLNFVFSLFLIYVCFPFVL